MVQTRHQKHDYPSDAASAEDEPSSKQAKVNEGDNAPKQKNKGNRKRGESDEDEEEDEMEFDEEDDDEEEEDYDDERDTSPQKGQTAGDKGKETAEARETYGISIQVNRAPVFMLWCTVVGERLGFSTEEAYTYGEWLTKELFQAKGKELGPEKKDAADRVNGGNEEEDEGDKEFVQIFGNLKIPIGKDKDGKKLAMKGKKMIDPTQVRHFVEHKFGVNLAAARNNMRGLADGIPPDEVRERAFELYEKFRPEWKGYGKTGTLDILAIDELANEVKTNK